MSGKELHTRGFCSGLRAASRSAAAAVVLAAGLLGPGEALAAVRPKTVTLNGGDVWTATPTNCTTNCTAACGPGLCEPATICPGETIRVDYQVQTTSNDDWESTNYTVETEPEGCANTGNHTSSGTFTETFTIPASDIPSTPGTYDLILNAEDGDDCTNFAGGFFTLANAVIVLSPLQSPCCTPSAPDDDTCDAVDDDCDGNLDEDAVNCVHCGDEVDACIYIMLDRTGSTSPQGLDDERDAAKAFLTFFAGVTPPPPVAIGTFGCNDNGPNDFPADGSGHLGECTGNADDACTLLSLSAPYGNDNGVNDGDHYGEVDFATGSESSTGTHFACALDVANTELAHGTCPADKHKILVFLSDGGDADGQDSLDAADHLKDDHDVEIFTILFPSESGTPTQAEQDQMEAIASEPKSNHYFLAPDSADLFGIFEDIADQISCDDGNDCTADVCDDGVCDYSPVVPCCGNNIVERAEVGNEECDGTGMGGECPPAMCQPDCTCSQICGDGVVEGTEQCDDGNNDAGDCCSPTCTFESLSTPCESDGDLCTVDHCNGAGDCVFLQNVMCQAANPPCEGGSVCNPGTGLCDPQPDAPQSTPCDADSDQCTLDHCNGSGACVYTGSDVVCQAPVPPCEGGEVCEPSTGLCVPEPDANLSTPCETDMDLCTLDHCNGSGACVYTGSDVTCQAPAPPCEGGEVCNPQSGTCVPQPDAVLSTPCEADGNLCTTDHCNGSGTCVFLQDVVCQAPSPPCEGGEVCNPGTGMCVPQADAPESTPCEADMNQCTFDHCNGSGMCVYTGNDVVCQDPVPPCEGGELCEPTTGLCVAEPDASMSTPCQADMDLCTLDHCDGSGACVYTGSDVACQDAVPPCEGGEVCDPQSGACVAQRDASSSTPCDTDADLCTIDLCDGNGACVPTGNDVMCTPPNPRRDICDGGEMCDPLTGICEELPDADEGTPCNRDTNLCTLDECDGDGHCIFVGDVTCPGSTGECDAGQNCEPTTGDCINRPDPPLNTPCEADDNLCTNDHCDGAGNCVYTGNDVMCQAPSPPCEGGQVCDTQTGACVDLPDAVLSTPCEADGDLCTNDHCDGFGDCVFLSDVICQQPLPPCESGEVCNPLSGLCVAQPDATLSTPCEADADLCTNDHCNGAGMCVFLSDVTCQAPNPPCEGGETCNPATGACVELPDARAGVPCEDDGNLCTIDQCDGSGQCVFSEDVACQPPSPPCEGGQVCNPQSGMCVDQPDAQLSTPCEADGNLCTTDHCNGFGVCVSFSGVVCDLPVPPCEGGEVCNPMTGQCVAQPDAQLSTPCEQDADLCTTDHCDGNGSCVFLADVICLPPNPPCDGGEACNPATGLCVPLPDGKVTRPCQADSDLCTIDYCNGAGMCVFIEDVSCVVANPPCEGGEVCEPATGNCVAQPDAVMSTPCEEKGNLCTIDYCNGVGQCVLLDDVTCLPASKPCDAGEVCDPGTGACVAQTDAPLSTPCEADGNLCTLDHCNGLGSCVLLQDVNCVPSQGQCDGGEDCNSFTGLCDDNTDPPLSTPCEQDSDVCTVEHCNGSGACVVLEAGLCGACCLPDGSCAETTADECAAAGGGLAGSDTTCDDDNGNGIADVCENPKPVPTIGRWGMIALTTILLVGIVLYARRRSLPAR